jgi:hypothetical protein
MVVLADAAAAARSCADSANLTIIPATPTCGDGRGWLVELGTDDMDPAVFVALAAAAGARLFYLEQTQFDASLELPVDDPDDEEPDEHTAARRVELRRRARSRNGQLCSVSLSFTAGSVLHLWHLDADWYSEILRQSEELASADHAGDLERCGRRERLERADVERLAQELLEIDAFRGTRNPADRARAARQHPELRKLDESGRSWDVYEVIRLATDLAAEQAEHRYADLRQRFGELAPRLAADQSFRTANNANLRRHAADDFLTAQAGGYRPSAVDRDRLLATPPLARSAQSRTAPGAVPLVDLPS